MLPPAQPGRGAKNSRARGHEAHGHGDSWVRTESPPRTPGQKPADRVERALTPTAAGHARGTVNPEHRAPLEELEVGCGIELPVWDKLLGYDDVE